MDAWVINIETITGKNWMQGVREIALPHQDHWELVLWAINAELDWIRNGR